MTPIFNIIWICWLLSEIFLSRLMRSDKADSKDRDKSSLIFIWISITISISFGVLAIYYLPSPISKTVIIGYLGLVLIICGMVVRFVAIRTLGRFFTVNLALHNNHNLIKTGLYKYIRHPAYTGSLLSFTGLGLSLNNWSSLVIIIIPVLVSFIYRINIEEKMLLQLFGEDYNLYKKYTKKLIPLLY